MLNKESYAREYKQEITSSFLKTVSAFANYNDGEVIFGITDDGQVAGIKNNIKQEILRIENMINDSIVPVPVFSIETEDIEGNLIIIVSVKKGKDTPYYCKGKAYKRSDTASVEVDCIELRRLSLEGINMEHEEIKASSQNLSFSRLEKKLIQEAGIEKLTLDVLKTLNLYNKSGYYNMAGELFSDTNDIVFSGVDIVRFGKDINRILHRKTISQVSLLEQFDLAMELFEQYYSYEEIDGYMRSKKELIPKEAFRESLANAMVHRVWDINSYIQMSMYDDKIEISSPGGLPAGISKEDYLLSNISVLRNPLIAGVFHRLNIIEKFGTGIARINKAYVKSITKPEYHLSEHRIIIILPLIKTELIDLYKDESIVYYLLKEETELSRKDIDERTGFDKSKTIRILNRLSDKNIVRKKGQGTSVRYSLM